MLRQVFLFSMVLALLVSSVVSQDIDEDNSESGDVEGCHIEPDSPNIQFESSPDIVVPLDPLRSIPSLEILQNLREFHPKNLAINPDE